MNARAAIQRRWAERSRGPRSSAAGSFAPGKAKPPATCSSAGDVIAELKLPDDLRPGGVPMTYMIQGKQYIVVAASATMKAAGVERAGELLAYTLP
jgi:hypothetical protein